MVQNHIQDGGHAAQRMAATAAIAAAAASISMSVSGSVSEVWWWPVGGGPSLACRGVEDGEIQLLL